MSTLTLEQQFHIRSIELSIEQLSPQELQSAFVELTEQLFAKENMIRDLVKEKLFAGIS
jgi:Phycobilisome degradation protein nblA